MNIYCLPIQNSSWQDTENRLLSYVSGKRQQTVLNYRHPIDQKLSLYAALLTRMKLSQLTGIPNDSLLFHYNPFGKPLLSSNPQYYFSFSHTHNIILCSISDKGSVGVDVEPINKKFPIKCMHECMFEAFHPIEIQYIKNIAVESQHTYFYKIWTQKEAYVKFLGTGFSTEVSSINTLEPSLASYFYTWLYQNYICSVFTHTPKQDFSIEFVHETDIQKYFFAAFL